MYSLQRYETANTCQVCAGFEFIPCRKCSGSKNSVSNKFTIEFRALRCTHCNENGLEACPACVESEEDSLKAGEEESEGGGVGVGERERTGSDEAVKYGKKEGEEREDEVKDI